MSRAPLHSQLAEDTHLLGSLSTAQLLLHREASLHWFILVPDTDSVDLLDLTAQQCAALMETAAALSALMKQDWDYPKVNFAALGNVVPQLHLHIVGRRPGDCCWPGPVWGQPLPGLRYSDEDLAAIVTYLRPLDLR